MVRALQRYGVRVQYSVFELRCTPRQLEQLRLHLAALIVPVEDSIISYPVPLDAAWRLGLPRPDAETPGVLVF